MAIRITLITILISISTLCQSQIIIALVFGDKLNSDKLKFGMDVGANYSTIKSFDNDYNRTSFNMGLFFEFKLSDRLILNPNLFFINEGGGQRLPNYSLNDPIIDTALSGSQVSRRMRYYSLPVLLKVRLFNQLYFDFGPQLSLLSKATDTFYEKTEKGNVKFETDIKSSINRWDFGVLAGFSYKMRKGEGISINLRFYQGFVPIYASAAQPTEYNQIIQGGVSFSIGTKTPEELEEVEKLKKENK